MNLNQYVKKKKSENFSIKKMAKELKIGQGTLYSILWGRLTPSIKLAIKIENYTKGEVSALDLVKRAYDKVKKERIMLE